MAVQHIAGVRSEISEILNSIREANAKTNVFSSGPVKPTAGKEGGFSEVINSVKQSVNTVNHLQQNTEQLKTAYLSGDHSVSMSQVVLASEKSKLAFEGLVVVRNKILEAYKDIMNMPV